MKPISVSFSKGVQFPPKLGSLILKETAPGVLAYSQNVDSSNDKYGNGAITPGPALLPIQNNSELTGVPIIKCFYGFSALNYAYLYFAEGILGAKNIIRRAINIISGSTPIIDDTDFILIDHVGHSNVELTDMVLRPDIANGQTYIYVTGKDANDIFVYKFIANIGSESLSAPIAVNSSFPPLSKGFIDPKLVLGADNNIYWIAGRVVGIIDTLDTYLPIGLTNGLPLQTYGTAATDWRQNLAVAYSTDAYGDFSRRLSAGSAGLILWDYENANFQKNISAPCRYISVLIPMPNGNLLAFGGIDEGKSSLFEFTGYGFNPLYSYIGDLPRSRHSVEFDGQGRVVWETADGHLCRYDFGTKIFDHLGVTDTQNGGGLLVKAIGYPSGNEFLIGYGKGTTYKMNIVSFGNFVGDPSGAAPTSPLAVSGIEVLPYQSAISAITWYITKPLQPGEKVQLLVYVNGNPTPIVYSTLDYAVDVVNNVNVMSKRETGNIPNVSSFSLGINWIMADGQATAPAILPAEVEID